MTNVSNLKTFKTFDDKCKECENILQPKSEILKREFSEKFIFSA